MKAGMMALGLLATLSGGPSGTPAKPATLYFFFGSEDPNSPQLAARVVSFVKAARGRVVLRPVLLVEDWRGLGRLRTDSPLVRTFETLKAILGEDLGIPLYDERGLRLAKAWRVTRLPALAIVAGGKARVAFGTRVDPEELLKCAR